MRKLQRHEFERLHPADEGQALVLTALGLMMFMLVAALGVDVGYLHYQQEQLQKAADAGAIAAASALSYNGNFMQAGLNDVAANGFQNGMSGITVTINNPPAAPDPFAGNTNYVQVVVTKPIPTFFMQVNNIFSVNVTARAVANSAASAAGCIFALDPNDSGTVTVDSGVAMSAGCGVYVNSNSPTALIAQSGGSMVTSGILGGIGVVGNDPGYSGSGSFTPTPVTSIPVFNDPFATLAPPTIPNNCYNANYNPPNGVYPTGCYYGINVPGNGGTYTFSPGTYILLGGGLNVPANSTVTGTGVTFFVTGTTVNPYTGVSIHGSPNLNISAPTSGPMAGILFFQDRTIAVGAASSSFDGTNGASFTGALYFPTTKVQFKGTPNTGSFTPIVAWQVEFNGNSFIENNFLPNNLSPVPNATLVE